MGGEASILPSGRPLAGAEPWDDAFVSSARADPRPAVRLHPGKRAEGSYLPSYETAEHDDEAQRAACAAVEAIPGWLRPEDALKLYELAFHAAGPILEIGCYRGKSSVLMARALRDAANPAPLVSVDVDPVALGAAAAAAGRHDVDDRVLYVRGLGRRAVPRDARAPPPARLRRRRPLAGGARRDLAQLGPRVPAGGLVLMHDYHDARNADPAQPALGVVQAVAESWMARDCAFGGVFGCSALFRRDRGGPDPGAAPAPILDLVIRDPLRLQLLQRVRWPLGRRLRALRGRGAG